MSPAPQPCAGKQGTVITAEDLFYNVRSRKSALKNGSEEFRRIMILVQKYAIHNDQVSFSCKKVGDTVASLSLSSRLSKADKIRHIYGPRVASHLKDFSLGEGQSSIVGFSANGFISNADFQDKKSNLILFINNRLVESVELRHALEETYAKYLHKGASYFVYLSLNMSPEQLDVNVHPSKRIVHFLYDQEIATSICDKLGEILERTDTERSYPLQTIIPSISNTKNAESSSQKAVRTYENYLVRTDPRERSIKSMLSDNFLQRSSNNYDNEIIEKVDSANSNNNATNDIKDLQTEEIVEEGNSIDLESIKSLQKQVINSMHVLATNILTEHKYVGLVCPTRRIAAVQHNIGLYVVDYGKLSYHLFYQICLTEFGNYGEFVLETPLSISDLFEIVNGDEDKSESEKFTRLLVSRRDMLKDYFSISVTSGGLLTAVPMLSPKYHPPFEQLPLLISSLTPKSFDWLDEKSCLNGIMKAIAKFYVPLPLSYEESDVKSIRSLESCLEDYLFPEFRRRVICPKKVFEEKCIYQITSLPRLYNVFERC